MASSRSIRRVQGHGGTGSKAAAGGWSWMCGPRWSCRTNTGTSRVGASCPDAGADVRALGHPRLRLAQAQAAATPVS